MHQIRSTIRGAGLATVAAAALLLGAAAPAALASAAAGPTAQSAARRPARRVARRGPRRVQRRGAARKPTRRAARRARLGLSVRPDPLAPDGLTPKLIWTIEGAAAGRTYRFSTRQLSGRSPFGKDESGRTFVQCGGIAPTTTGVTATRKGPLTLERYPTPLGSEQDGYAAYGGSSPCTGRYAGVLEELTGSNRRTAKLEFTLTVPDLALKVTWNGS